MVELCCCTQTVQNKSGILDCSLLKQGVAVTDKVTEEMLVLVLIFSSTFTSKGYFLLKGFSQKMREIICFFLRIFFFVAWSPVPGHSFLCAHFAFCQWEESVSLLICVWSAIEDTVYVSNSEGTIKKYGN